MWTHFWDMHSGGGQKEDYTHIYIEAPQEQAKIIFYNRFGHNPERVTCTCCGRDYSISEYETLDEATSYEMKDDNITLEEFQNKKDVLVIYEREISEYDKEGEVPKQGYVWVD